MARRKLGPKRSTTIAMDLNKMEHDLRMAIAEIGDGILGELAAAVAEEARSRAPTWDDDGFGPRGPNKRGGDHRSGPLKKSIFYQRSDKVPGSYIVCSPAWYSHFVEFGTHPHEIYPKWKKALAFPVSNTKMVITDSVSHPGFEHKPFMRPAEDMAEILLKRILASRSW